MNDAEVEDFLAHYGIKGMRWGVRRNKTQRRAAKDAKEFANAKMFYGEGAGTRRKLIREKVASNKKRSSEYAKAFDEAYAKQDLGKAGEKAVGERKRKDFSKKNKQRAGAVARRVTGEWGTQAAFIAIAAGGVAYLNSPDGKAKVRQAVNKINSPKARQAQAKGADYLADYLKRNG